METIDCELNWVQFFELEVVKHRGLDVRLIEAIRNDLQARHNRLKPPAWRDEREHQASMIKEARNAITGALKVVKQRLRLQLHDELQMGAVRGQVLEADSAGKGIDDLLDDLLTDVDVLDWDSVGKSELSAESDLDSVNSDNLSLATEVLAENTDSDEPIDLANYEFPDTEHLQTEFEPFSNADLRKQLGEILRQRNSKGQLVSYMEIRDKCCAIGEVMNRRGLLPPRFRDKRSLPKPIKGKRPEAADTVLMRDRQVLDLHWLHCQGKRDSLVDHKEFETLFSDGAFCFELAARFACKGWSIPSKTCKVLNLHDQEQWQMAYYRVKAVDDAWRNAEISMNTTIDKRLREHAFKEPGFAEHISDMKQVWLADKIAGGLGLTIVGRVFGWLKGEEPLAKSTLSAKLKRMQRRTAPKASRS